MRRRHTISALAAVVALAGTLWAPTSARAADPAPPAAEMPPPALATVDEQSARLRAVRTGKQVEIQSATTETMRVFANPSGTLSAQLSAVPQRVHRPDNTWAPVDTRLRVSGGVLRPAATVSPVAFSLGGKAALARLSTRAGSLAYTWPKELPTPTVEGDTAVYADVYPGVDLRVQALVDGFTYFLVVKTRQAAAHPDLRKITLGVSGDGVTVAARRGGGFVAKGRDGKPAIVAGEALMWDQRGAPDELSAPADKARTSSLTTTYTNGALTVQTDSALLTSPDAVFPIVIDPVSRTIPGSGAPFWGFASSDNENRTDGIARVGPDPDEYSSVWRSFFAFPVTSTIGGPAKITGAAFQTWLVHSGACSSKPVNLYGAGGFGSGRNNWPGASLDVDLGTRWGNANKSSCSQQDMFMECFTEVDTGYVPQPGITADRTKLLVGDVNGDAKDDVMVVFEQGGSWWKVWVSLANGSGTFFAAPAMWYENPAGWSDYRRSRWFSGDFNGDGKAEFGHFYNYDNCQTKFWAHRSTGTSFTSGAMKWDGGTWNWCWDRAFPVAVDIDGNETSDIASAYRYDGCQTKVWLWRSVPDAAQEAGFSAVGGGDRALGSGWCGEKITLAPGEYTGDAYRDLRIVYDCCGANQYQVWSMESEFGAHWYSPVFSRQGGFGPIGTGNMTLEHWQPYQIVAASDGNCLTVPSGSLGNTIQVRQRPCGPAEYFNSVDIIHESPDAYRIRFRHSFKCLNVRGSSADAGMPVDQYDCQRPPQNNEAWRIRYVSGAQDPLVEQADCKVVWSCSGG